MGLLYSVEEMWLLFNVQYIKKRNRSGGIFHWEFDDRVENVKVFLKVLKTVHSVCPYKEVIVYISVVV